MKSSSFGGSLKNIPQEPQDQAIFFFRKLLRAESYRKALVWQKRYLSLLLSSYQESEILSLGRLARMSGARKMLVADIPRPQGKNVQFRLKQKFTNIVTHQFLFQSCGSYNYIHQSHEVSSKKMEKDQEEC